MNQSSPRAKRTFHDFCNDPQGWEWLFYIPYVMVFSTIVGTAGMIWVTVGFVGLLLKRIATVLFRN